MVTYPMIVDALGLDASDWTYEGDLDVRFGYLVTSPTASALNRTDDGAVLFVGSPRACKDALQADEFLHAICCVDSLADDDCGVLAQELLFSKRCFLVFALPQGPDLVSRLYGLFLSAESWQRKVGQMLVADESLSKILDVSALHLRCPLVMSGVGLKVVAYSRSLLPEDALILPALEKGFFEEEQVAYFRNEGMPAVWDSADGLTVVEQTTPSRDYPIVFYIFRMHDSYYLHLTIHCNHRAPTRGLLDELGVLVDAIDAHIRMHPPSAEVFGTGLPALMARIARGEMALDRSARMEFRQAGIGDETLWRLHLVDYGFDENEEQLAMRAALDLLMRVPEALVAVVGPCAIVLEPNPAGDDDFPSSLAEHARVEKARICVSDIFRGPQEMLSAYRQLMATRRVLALEPAKSHAGELSFTDAFCDYFVFIKHWDRSLVDDCFEHSIVARIMAEDARCGGRDLAMLRCYLLNERRVSAVVDELGVSRSTLLYRIRRIESLYGVTLDNAATRNRMLMEMRIVEVASPDSKDIL